MRQMFFNAAALACAGALAAACGQADTTSETTAEPAAAAAPEAAAVDWRALYLADLDAIKAALEAHHMGPIDDENPAFRVWLEDGYDQARARAGAVDGPIAYDKALRAYVNGFKDGHLSLATRLGDDVGTDLEWPGFVVAWRDGAAVVHATDEDVAAPAAGDAIASCDGRRPDDIVVERFFTYRLDEALPGKWPIGTPWAFADDGDPFAPRPETCVFVTDAGEETVTLDWRPIAREAFAERARAAAYGDRPEAAMAEMEPGVFWVSIPTMGPNEEQQAIYEQAMATLAAADPLHLVVFDVRGNGGGSSLWGRRFAEAVWGVETVAALAPEDVSNVDWRVSDTNVRHLHDLIPQIRSMGDPRIDAYFDELVAGMDAALAAGEAVWREDVEFDEEGGAGASRELPFNGVAVVLTDGACASACLDFMDVLKPLPRLAHLGGPTSADTQYMENRHHALTSEKAALYAAMKVYRDRPRGAGDYYEPDLAYAGEWTDDAVKSWVLGTWASGGLAAAVEE